MKASLSAGMCVVVLFAVACGARSGRGDDSSATASGSTSSTSVLAPATSQPKAITIDGFSYVVAAAMPPGAQITVTNNDSVAHTVTADSAGGFDIKLEASSQATFTAPRQPGTYPFHCTYHPNMHAQLAIVQPD